MCTADEKENTPATLPNTCTQPTGLLEDTRMPQLDAEDDYDPPASFADTCHHGDPSSALPGRHPH
jgi:hypothetical protein